jgi:hypothetical protein
MKSKTLSTVMIITNFIMIAIIVCRIIGLHYLTDQNFRGKNTDEFNDNQKGFMKFAIVVDWIQIGFALLALLLSLLIYLKVIKTTKSVKVV